MSKELQNVRNTVGQFLMKQKGRIEAALPSHLTADRMLSIVMTEIRKNPDLSKCTLSSLISAVIQCSQLGLEPGGSLGHAYLIPFYNKKASAHDCQFMIGYRGMIDLARRSQQIVSITAQVVYEKDLFEFEYGLNEKLRHIPHQGDDKGILLGAYALAKLTGGGYQFEVIYKNGLDKVREFSLTKMSDNAKKYSPWNTSYEEMARKTVVRRLFKYLPVSIEIQKAVTLDESAECGEQDNRHLIDLGSDDFELQQESSKADEIAEKLGANQNEQSEAASEYFGDENAQG